MIEFVTHIQIIEFVTHIQMMEFVTHSLYHTRASFSLFLVCDIQLTQSIT